MKLWKLQKFFGDIVYDLRSRGLLPVLILLVVALVAVPVLISRGSSHSSASVQPAASVTKPAPEAETAVVSYVPPGIRNYKGRLDDLSAKDPFRQPAGSTQSAAAASQLSSTVATPATVSGGSSGASGTGSTSTSTGTSTRTGTSNTVTRRLYLYRSVADISEGEVGQPLVRHKHIKTFTSLPNRVTPVMIYLGSSLDQKRAYFSVSKNAQLVPGEGACVPSPADCSLLALEPGKSADMTYSVNGKSYRVKVNRIELRRTRAG